MPHKKMMNMKVMLWLVIIFTIGLIVTKTVSMDIPVETGILGTMYTFFYGLFINSLFKFLDEKYVNFRTYLGDLIGKVQALYNCTLLTNDDKYIKRIREELIAFVKSFNAIKATRYYLNQYRINLLYAITREFKIKNKKDEKIYSETLSLINDLSATREKLEIFGSKQITKETRLIFLSTTVIYIIVIAFLTFSKESIYLNLIGALLIIMVIFVTIMMFDVDDLSHGTYYIKDKNLEEMAELMEGKIQTEADNKK
jgi:hypothetical protein